VPVYHIDAYRLRGPADANALGMEEMFFGDGVAVVEWAERIEAALPPERLEIALEIAGEDEREISLTPLGTRYERLLRNLESVIRNQNRKSAL
jgi:tRNA threonylcarbamoyladenosine biosynthesis protein TsaE